MVTFLGPYYNTGPNLGDPKRDHNFDNPPVADATRRIIISGDLGRANTWVSSAVPTWFLTYLANRRTLNFLGFLIWVSIIKFKLFGPGYWGKESLNLKVDVGGGGV